MLALLGVALGNMVLCAALAWGPLDRSGSLYLARHIDPLYARGTFAFALGAFTSYLATRIAPFESRFPAWVSAMSGVLGLTVGLFIGAVEPFRFSRYRLSIVAAYAIAHLIGILVTAPAIRVGKGSD